MRPVSKKEFFEIIDRLLKIEDDVLNFGYIESNMKVLKYFVKFYGFIYYHNNNNGNSFDFSDFFDSYYQTQKGGILYGGTIVSFKLDNRLRQCSTRDYYYKYSIRTLEPHSDPNYRAINVFYSIHLYDYDKYVRDYYLEHPELYQISRFQIKKKYWQDLNKELIENRFNPINIEKFESWGFELDY